MVAARSDDDGGELKPGKVRAVPNALLVSGRILDLGWEGKNEQRENVQRWTAIGGKPYTYLLLLPLSGYLSSSLLLLLLV